MTAHPKHFVELIQRHVEARGDALLYRFLKADAEVDTLSYSGLDACARQIASLLHRLEPGSRAMLLFPPGLNFIRAFIGCWYAGVAPVPCMVPRGGDMARLSAVRDDCAAAVILTETSVEASVKLLAEERGLPLFSVDALDEVRTAASPPARIDSSTVALLQYTSGSTGTPKGVTVSHGNLLHNERMIEGFFGHDATFESVGWLPTYHDMGLIGFVLQPLYLGRSVTLMSPADFMMNPMRWLRAITKYRAFTSGGPNFAYDLCADAAQRADLTGLDLSSWKLAFTGAEPVRAKTMARFRETFEPYGFRPESLYPCYGLAEATLIVTGGQMGTIPRAISCDRKGLEAGVVEANGDQASAIEVVSCGAPILGTEVRVVDPEKRVALPPRRIGEVWVRGASVARGYWNNPELTEVMFGATLAEGDERYLRTGDLAFLDGGELFIVGRLKDILIIRGRNHHPEDIEQTVGDSAAEFRLGATASFTVLDEQGDEALVVVQELQRRRPPASYDPVAVENAVRANVTRFHGLRLHRLVVTVPGQIPRTTSGKVRRRECRRLFLENAFGAATASGATP